MPECVPQLSIITENQSEITVHFQPCLATITDKEQYKKNLLWKILPSFAVDVI